MILLFSKRLFCRLSLWFHKYWWASYLIACLCLVVFGIFALNRWLGTNISILPKTFSELAMALGGIAVLAVAIRQHQDAKLQTEAILLPKIVRMCGDPVTGGVTFDWEKNIFVATTTPPLDADQVLKRSLGFLVFPKSMITDLQGYLLKGGYFFKLHFVERNILANITSIAASGSLIPIQLPGWHTWAYGGNDPLGRAYVALIDPSSSKTVQYPGYYYCLTFCDISGTQYFLEEDHTYRMHLSKLSEGRPTWKRDFISYL